jgi:diguanylate cyclase (GGDEF)-like protein
LSCFSFCRRWPGTCTVAAAMALSLARAQACGRRWQAWASQALRALLLCGMSAASPLGALAWGGAHAANPVVLDAAFSRAAIGQHLQVLEDTTGHLGLAEVQAPAQARAWHASASASPNFGYSHSAFWLRGDVVNQSGAVRDWLLGMRYPLLDYVDVYVLRPDGRVQHQASGDRLAFGTRPLPDRQFYFPLALKAGERVQVMVRVQGQGSLQAPLELSTPAAFHALAYREQLLVGLYGGAMLSMLLYNLLLGLSLRDRAHLYYVVYIALFGLAQFALSGLAFEHLWPDSPTWGNLATPLLMGLASWALVLFSRQFLSLAQHWPRADRWLQWLQLGFLTEAALSLLLPYNVAVQAVTTGTTVTPLLLLVVTVVLLRRGVCQARFFLAAFSGLLLGVALTSLHLFGLIPATLLTEYGVQMGTLLEFALLSFALAHRLKLAQEANVLLQQAHAAELEARVQARTLDLDHAMNALTQANARLHALSHQDALTGLKNRAFMGEQLPEMWRSAQRWQSPISVLMIDVDHFKQVNDMHGHAAGDEALRQVAGVITRLVQRPGDHALRFGGEEFLVLLPQTHAVGAAHIAESIRLGVQALDVRVEGKRLALTVSIGVACTVPSPELAPQALLKAADRLLYMAKRDGRNRCALQPEALAVRAKDKYLAPDEGAAPPRLKPVRPNPVSSG